MNYKLIWSADKNNFAWSRICLSEDGYCTKEVMVPTLQELQHASESCLPKAYLHKGISSGHCKTTTARGGGGVSTGSSLSVHGAWGRPRQGWDLQLPWQDDGIGRQRHPGRAALAVQSPGDMDRCRTGSEEWESHPTVGSKVLQGSSTGCILLWQQDLKPPKSHTDMARGVPCSSHLLHDTSS